MSHLSDIVPGQLEMLSVSKCGTIGCGRLSGRLLVDGDRSTFSIDQPQKGESVLPLTGRSVPISVRRHAANTHRHIKLTCRDKETKRQRDRGQS